MTYRRGDLVHTSTEHVRVVVARVDDRVVTVDLSNPVRSTITQAASSVRHALPTDADVTAGAWVRVVEHAEQYRRVPDADVVRGRIGPRDQFGINRHTVRTADGTDHSCSRYALVLTCDPAHDPTLPDDHPLALHAAEQTRPVRLREWRPGRSFPQHVYVHDPSHADADEQGDRIVALFIHRTEAAAACAQHNAAVRAEIARADR